MNSSTACLIVGDSAEPRIIADCRKNGINILAATKGQDSVRKGIKDIQGFKIVVTPDSVNLKRELNNYVWSDRNSEVPVDDYNHLLDALRYSFSYLYKKPVKRYIKRN